MTFEHRVYSSTAREIHQNLIMKSTAFRAILVFLNLASLRNSFLARVIMSKIHLPVHQLFWAAERPRMVSVRCTFSQSCAWRISSYSSSAVTDDFFNKQNWCSRVLEIFLPSIFFEFAEPFQDVNAQKSVLELGFDESRFIDKAGRMGLARSRGDLLETFTFMQEEADSEWIDLLDWNNLIDRNKSFGDIFVIDNHGETVKLMKGTVTAMFVVSKFTGEHFDR